MKNDPVLALNDSLLKLAAERTQLADEHARCQTAETRSHEVDDAFVAHSEKWHPAMRRLADTPATTIDGVLVKLRTLAGSMLTGRETVYDEDILLLAIADL
jgi:hypothetical protein